SVEGDERLALRGKDDTAWASFFSFCQSKAQRADTGHGPVGQGVAVVIQPLARGRSGRSSVRGRLCRRHPQLRETTPPHALQADQARQDRDPEGNTDALHESKLLLENQCDKREPQRHRGTEKKEKKKSGGMLALLL